MIKLINVSKQYGSINALDNVTINIEGGTLNYIIGPNASGKTTLIKLILGLIKPSSGKLFVNEVNLNGSHEYKESIGYMPQVASFPENLSVKEIFQMLKGLRNSKSNYDEELIEKFNLVKDFNKQIKNLSGGTKQKVNAAISFLFDPEILILDEPTASLDPYAGKILKEKIIKEHKKGKTIIFTSHVLNDLGDIATDYIFLLEGKVIMNLKKENIKDQTLEELVLSFIKENSNAYVT
ncbi:ABC transporter ATP-binding protein [Rosettibacter firmus]|uniref:ABC transporter ATP-binding protein n=1 Tax=Rosettibacter firmus TaxID=3111522 RepID=UPI00336C2049